MKKTTFFKKTALSLLISSAIFTTNPVEAVYSNAILDFSSLENFDRPIDVTQQFRDKGVFSLGSGTVTFRVKPNGGFNNLLGVSDPASNVRYASFYVNTRGNKVQYGVELRTDTNTRLIPNSELVTPELPITNEFRTVTYAFDKANQTIKIYVDGQLQKSTNQSKFFEDISGLTTATLGSLTRASYPANNFSGSIYHAGAIDDVLSDEAIARLHSDIVERQRVDIQKNAEKLAFLHEKRTNMGAFMSEKEELFKPGQGGARSYRIPGLFTTKDGVVIAAIDKRNQHASDWGNIDLAVRRSLDGGLTWQEDQVVVDLATQPYQNLGPAESALVIDGVMTQDKKSGRIFMMFDMFPESQALFGMFNDSKTSYEAEGNGHIKVNDKWYRLITDGNGQRYTVREGGIVYNSAGEAQDYRIVVEGDPNRSFKDLGDIIRISDNERIGNIFLRSKRAGHDSGSFNAHYTSYLWMTYSDDNGKTWASPVDITTQVKADWMRFLGTGPGTGIQLKNGNLMIPVYYTNRDNKQSAAVIVSSDGGKTWKRGESPNDAYHDEIGGSRYINNQQYELTESQVVEMNNGDIKMFSRNRTGAVVISTSHDGGMTWDKSAYLREAALLDPYSQMSVIHYSKLIDGKEYLVFANPHANTRRNGKAWLGEVQPDGSIEWKYHTTIDEGTYAYNSLTELPNGDIGLLYEQVQGENAKFVRFNLQELFWKSNMIYRDSRNTSNPNVSLNSIEEETYYKIGDGEMVKVGEGINPAHLEVREGISTLNQQANSAGEKQAYASVLVKEKGTLRLADNEQLNLSKVNLEKGTLDLFGRDFTLAPQANTENQGLRSPTITGNIVNHATTAATFNYQLDGEHRIVGKVGDNQGDLNLNYQPTETQSALILDGTSRLNQIEVKKGNLVYADHQHQAKQINLATGSQVTLQNNAVLNAQKISLANNATVAIESEQIVQLNTNTEGDGQLIKTGNGYAKVSGELNHTGNTQITGGIFELNGNIKQSAVNFSGNSVLAGQGSIGGTLTLSEGSRIQPTMFVANPQEFNGNRLTLNHLNNEGGSFMLTVNNDSEQIKNWRHDQVLLKGKLESEQPMPVDIQLLNNHLGNSDKNNNGRYDADEGISLIQVKDPNALQKVALRQILSLDRSAGLHPLTLVSVEAGVSAAADNQVSDTANSDFTDFRLQNVMIDETGQPLEPVIRKPKPVEPTPPVVENPVQPVKPIPPVVENPVQPVKPTPSVEEKPVQPVKPTPPVVEKPVQPAEPAPPVADAELKPSRSAVLAQVPSYIVSNTALYHQGNQIQGIFQDNIELKHKHGIYVIQSHTKHRYHNDLGFTNYGYHYKSSQNTTLLGGYVSLNDHSELHSALAFSQQKVEPQAADGYSQAKYKTVSALAALNNRWDNWLFKIGLGYHHHKGDISTAKQQDISSVKAHQLQFFGQLGYDIPVGKFSLTPTTVLSYQYLHNNIKDSGNGWKIDNKNYRVFTQQLGTYLNWKGEKLTLKAGVFYEYNRSNNPKVVISPTANQSEDFAIGKLGNAMVYKVAATVNITQNLTFGLQVSHRQALSQAKLKQTNVLGKLEYQF
ncbi:MULTISPECIES: exo-alpha-sialidase [Rodentibacter]|uniref:exo-alpha-sialidase n=1 Tax=Rodentibacter TaxID=1960084 RepID=UPI001CFE2F01|nr:exo-alpha-sialidase [Rodentibacter sp. JRC1]GJI56201.1 hypothetical protein HEMROJRC1_13130 [Rodentibacter sp. JRC1]